MKCKYCDALIEENATVCPVCGKELTEVAEEAAVEEVAEETVVEETAAEETVTEVSEEETALDEATEQVKEKKSSAPLILSIVAAVAALGCLALLLMLALGVELKDYLPRPNDIGKKDTYIVADEKAEDKADDVIATIGDKELTNAQLQIYYRMQVIDLLNYYGSYASQIGLDISKPLSEQTCGFDDTMTWEQYLIKASIETWQNYQVIALLAEEAGFTLSEEDEKVITDLPKELEAQVEDSEYDSVEEMIKEVIGPSCTLEEYVKFVRLACVGKAYYDSLNKENVPTQEEIEAYYEKEKATFEEQGITKDMGNIADVRHILVMPKDGELNEETNTTEYSEEQWKACYQRAEEILNEWKNGAATEESFAQLATLYTEDGGSAENGGLYEDIAPGASYVENFLNWTIDPDRKTGDTDIIQTEYGYHIMYYVEGEPYWTQLVETQLIADRITETTDKAEEKWPMKVNYRKIALSELNLD